MCQDQQYFAGEKQLMRVSLVSYPERPMDLHVQSYQRVLPEESQWQIPNHNSTRQSEGSSVMP